MTDVVPDQRSRLSRSALVALVVLGAATATNLAAQLLGAATLAETSQWFLMPALAAALWCTTAASRSRLERLVLLALGFSWVGDVLPDFFTGDAAFLAMVGGFLCAQVVYAVAFRPFWRESVLHLHPAAGAVYGFLAITLVTLCLPGTSGLLSLAVVVYAACLTAMAVLATGVHRLTWVGALLFLFSDALIALGAFAGFAPPASGFWVMATYVLGQALIVAGVVSRGGARR